MEGIKTENWVDCRKSLFGSGIDEFKLTKEYVIFSVQFASFKVSQINIIKKFSLKTNRIKGIDFINIKKDTTNWFEKIFSNYEDGLRFYY